MRHANELPIIMWVFVSYLYLLTSALLAANLYSPVLSTDKLDAYVEQFNANDDVLYHGRILTIIWDKTGDKYGKGKGLFVFADGKEIARS